MPLNIIGILNVTPDSFSDGGRYLDPQKACAAACRMRNEGADLIDIGAVSTRPGAHPVSPAEEIRRLEPALERISRELPTDMLSVDAASIEAGLLALDYGVRVLNLCGGLRDAILGNALREVKGTAIIYPGHATCREPLVEGRLAFFREQIARAEDLHLILDPGLGFGITSRDSILLLRQFRIFKMFHLPLAVGISRKRHLAELMGASPEKTRPADRGEAGLAAAAIAVLQGASYIRTHDVRASVRFFRAFTSLLSTSTHL